jgi:hypothetical protein
MNELNKSLQNLDFLNKKECSKKKTFFNITEKKNDETKNGLLLMFQRKKELYEYKNTLRLKSLRTKKEMKISEDFNEKIEEIENNIFNKKWMRLSINLRKNRLYKYFNEKQITFDDKIIEDLCDKKNKNLIKYDDKNGFIIEIDQK